ncbi:MAG: fluoride efflux transporter CrcB [Hyphomicrobiales bacterium]
MHSFIIVFIGGGLGASLRHLINQACQRFFTIEFPMGIMLINISGSIIMGLAAGYFALKVSVPWSDTVRLFMATGVLGGYTTFSAFSLDALVLWERGESGLAMAYVFGSVVLSIIGLAAGLGIVRALT